MLKRKNQNLCLQEMQLATTTSQGSLTTETGPPPGNQAFPDTSNVEVGDSAVDDTHMRDGCEVLRPLSGREREDMAPCFQMSGALPCPPIDSDGTYYTGFDAKRPSSMFLTTPSGCFNYQNTYPKIVEAFTIGPGLSQINVEKREGEIVPVSCSMDGYQLLSMLTNLCGDVYQFSATSPNTANMNADYRANMARDHLAALHHSAKRFEDSNQGISEADIKTVIDKYRPLLKQAFDESVNDIGPLIKFWNGSIRDDYPEGFGKTSEGCACALPPPQYMTLHDVPIRDLVCFMRERKEMETPELKEAMDQVMSTDCMVMESQVCQKVDFHSDALIRQIFAKRLCCARLIDTSLQTPTIQYSMVDPDSPFMKRCAGVYVLVDFAGVRPVQSADPDAWIIPPVRGWFMIARIGYQMAHLQDIMRLISNYQKRTNSVGVEPLVIHQSCLGPRTVGGEAQFQDDKKVVDLALRSTTAFDAADERGRDIINCLTSTPHANEVIKNKINVQGRVSCVDDATMEWEPPEYQIFMIVAHSYTIPTVTENITEEVESFFAHETTTEEASGTKNNVGVSVTLDHTTLKPLSHNPDAFPEVKVQIFEGLLHDAPVSSVAADSGAAQPWYQMTVREDKHAYLDRFATTFQDGPETLMSLAVNHKFLKRWLEYHPGLCSSYKDGAPMDPMHDTVSVGSAEGLDPPPYAREILLAFMRTNSITEPDASVSVKDIIGTHLNLEQLGSLITVLETAPSTESKDARDFLTALIVQRVDDPMSRSMSPITQQVDDPMSRSMSPRRGGMTRRSSKRSRSRSVRKRSRRNVKKSRRSSKRSRKRRSVKKSRKRRSVKKSRKRRSVKKSRKRRSVKKSRKRRSVKKSRKRRSVKKSRRKSVQKSRKRRSVKKSRKRRSVKKSRRTSVQK